MNSPLHGSLPRAIGSTVVALSCAAFSLTLGACSPHSSSNSEIPSGFAQIQAGTFQMGEVGVEEPVHTVTISYPFWMGATEVTQAEYAALIGRNPSQFQGSEYPDSANQPVEQVSWHDARSYCKALTAQQSARGSVPTGYEYRLPTEAEWEYACRAGTTTSWNVGNSLNCSQASHRSDNHDHRSDNYDHRGGRVHVVGRFAPNARGLYDMHGNVWEWCLDSYAGYPSSAVTDPFVTGGPDRPLRGGSWDSYSFDCRSAVRHGAIPDYTRNDIGFRVVLAPVLVP